MGDVAGLGFGLQGVNGAGVDILICISAFSFSGLGVSRVRFPRALAVIYPSGLASVRMGWETFLGAASVSLGPGVSGVFVDGRVWLFAPVGSGWEWFLSLPGTAAAFARRRQEGATGGSAVPR